MGLYRLGAVTIVATILFINDAARVLEAVPAVLEGKGYRVLVAPNGATGIEISRKYHIDAVVLRFASTGKDANQVADVLAKEQPKLPVAIRSDFPDDIPESLKWFADALLQTSATPEALVSAIENLIVNRKMVEKVAHRETLVSSQAA
jgi:DNA-binding NtrC family response regulator